MAANAWQVYHQALEKIGEGTIKLNIDDFKCALCSTDYTPSSTGHWEYADISASLSSSAQYPGDVLTSGVTWVRSNGVLTFDMNDVSFSPTSSVTIRARWGVLYDDTTTSDCLLAYAELTSDGTYVESTNGTFEIQINASGVFSLTQT